MITPDAAVNGDALLLCGSRPADVRVGHDAIAAVEPAIRPPNQIVEDVMLGLQIPAVKHHLRRTGGFVLARTDRNEEQMRRSTQPDATETDGDAGKVRTLV